jgi:hypothetical protein
MEAIAMAQAERGWLKCEVSPGLFETEWLVLVREVSHDKLVELTVDRLLVRTEGQPTRGKPVPGRLSVLVHRTEQNRADVSLPVPSVEFGLVIAVPADHLAG